MDHEQQPQSEAADVLPVEQQEGDPAAVPHILVVSELDYASDVLYGDWFDATRPAAELWTDVQRLLQRSPTAARTGDAAEEWAVVDFRHFGSYRVPASVSMTRVSAVAQGIRTHGSAFAAWADLVGDDDVLDEFADAYLGAYESLEAYVEQSLNDTEYNRLLDDALPYNIRCYVSFDVQGLARDMRLSGEVTVYENPEGGVWLFDRL